MPHVIRVACAIGLVTVGSTLSFAQAVAPPDDPARQVAADLIAERRANAANQQAGRPSVWMVVPRSPRPADSDAVARGPAQ